MVSPQVACPLHATSLTGGGTTVHAPARQAEAVMLEENSDRFVMMEGHEFELHDAV